MNVNVRKFTNEVIIAVENEFLSWEDVARACLNYMSEDEVAEMVMLGDLIIADEEEENIMQGGVKSPYHVL